MRQLFDAHACRRLAFPRRVAHLRQCDRRARLGSWPWFLPRPPGAEHQRRAGFRSRPGSRERGKTSSTSCGRSGRVVIVRAPPWSRPHAAEPLHRRIGPVAHLGGADRPSVAAAVSAGGRAGARGEATGRRDRRGLGASPGARDPTEIFRAAAVPRGPAGAQRLRLDNLYPYGYSHSCSPFDDRRGSTLGCASSPIRRRRRGYWRG